MKLRAVTAGVLSMVAAAVWAADYTVNGQFITIPVQQPKTNGAKVVRLQVVTDNIIRVQATSADQLPEKQSLIIVKQTSKPKFEVTDGQLVRVKAANVEARVDKKTGQVLFYDATGKKIIGEAEQGKTFKPFRVPDREIGVDVAKVPEEQRNGLSWHLLFDGAPGNLYGLGQHQSEELNMYGKNEDLFQYNTKVSVPFVLSSKNYGVLWDAYSYGRFGNPDDYQQLNRIFKLYDKKGAEGHLTGTYTDQNGKTLVRQEDSIYYEFDTPEKSLLAQQTEPGGIKNLPKGFNLNGAQVVYEGFIEPTATSSFNFILYYAGYIKVYETADEGSPLPVAHRVETGWRRQLLWLASLCPQPYPEPTEHLDGDGQGYGLLLHCWSECRRDYLRLSHPDGQSSHLS